MDNRDDWRGSVAHILGRLQANQEHFANAITSIQRVNEISHTKLDSVVAELRAVDSHLETIADRLEEGQKRMSAFEVINKSVQDQVAKLNDMHGDWPDYKKRVVDLEKSRDTFSTQMKMLIAIGSAGGAILVWAANHVLSKFGW